MTYGYDLAGRMTSVGDTSAAVTDALDRGELHTTTTTLRRAEPAARIRQLGARAAAQTSTHGSASVTFRHGYDPTNRRIRQTATDNSWWSYPTNPSTTTRLHGQQPQPVQRCGLGHPDLRRATAT